MGDDDWKVGFEVINNEIVDLVMFEIFVVCFNFLV